MENADQNLNSSQSENSTDVQDEEIVIEKSQSAEDASQAYQPTLEEVAEEKPVVEPVSAEPEAVNSVDQLVENQPETCVEESEAVETKSDEDQVTENVMEYPQFESLLKNYFISLRDFIRITKTKDETMVKLQKELAKYREDFGYSLCKGLITGLIAYREDSRKALRDLEKFPLTKDKAEKNISYMKDDLLELYSNYGMELDGETFTLYGKELSSLSPRKIVVPAPVEEKVVEEATTNEEQVQPVEEKATIEHVVKLVEENKAKIEQYVHDNQALDSSLAALEKIVASLDDNYADAITLPLYRSLASLYRRLDEKIGDVLPTITEENCNELYANILDSVIVDSESILIQQGVHIASDPTDDYDIKLSRVMKVVITDKKELDHKVAVRYSDSYLYAGKVIYPSKVDVYKYQEN